MRRITVASVGRARPLLGVLIAIVMASVITTDALALTWRSDAALTKSGTGYAYPGSLAVSSATVAHSIYEQEVLGSFVVSYRRSTNAGATWATPIILSRPGAGTAGVPSIDAYGSAVDAVWLEGDALIAGVDSAVFYRRSANAGATWLDAVQLSPLFESAGFPCVAHVGSTVAVVWTNEATGHVYVRISTNGGATFKSRIDLATTTNRPFGVSLLDGFPIVTFGSGVIYVGYYSAPHALRIRRSTTGGSSWHAAQTIATNADGSWPASVAATGSAALVGYAARTSTDSWTVIRRSTNKGTSWGSAISLSPSSSYRSFQPVITYRGGFRAVFERCSSTACSTSNVYYRSSSTGATWTPAIAAGVRKRSYESPADVDVATKVLILYDDANASANDVYVRRGS